MTIDDVITTVHKLSPKDGDTIVVRFDSKASGVLIGTVRNVMLDQFKRNKVKFLFLKEGFEISKLDEVMMEELGWVRKSTNNDTSE